jgi:hypothetical protein
VEIAHQDLCSLVGSYLPIYCHIDTVRLINIIENTRKARKAVLRQNCPMEAISGLRRNQNFTAISIWFTMNDRFTARAGLGNSIFSPTLLNPPGDLILSRDMIVDPVLATLSKVSGNKNPRRSVYQTKNGVVRKEI